MEGRGGEGELRGGGRESTSDVEGGAFQGRWSFLNTVKLLESIKPDKGVAKNDRGV